jgi:hypothetical protein
MQYDFFVSTDHKQTKQYLDAIQMTDAPIKVRLELHAQGLKNVAGFGYGSSDPFAVVTLLANDPKQKPQVIGSTEVYVQCRHVA